MPFRVEYPGSLEDWWIRRTLREYSCNSLDQREAQIERSIQSLSDGFTLERPKNLSGNYFAHPELLCAYGLFFFPQNYVRTELVLQEILSRGWEPPETLRVLDLGCGTGSASFGAASIFSKTPTTVTAVDRSKEALTTMQTLASDCSSLWPLLQLELHQEDLWSWARQKGTEKAGRLLSSRVGSPAVPGAQWDLIIASFALNESEFLTARATDDLTRLLSDHGLLLLIEPALKSTSEILETWRDQIAQRSDLHIWGPCLHQSFCPLLREGKYWCHEVRSWDPPASLSFLNRHLYRQTHVLKFSFLVLGKQSPKSPGTSAFRLISPVSKRKKSLVFTGCTMEGQKKDFQIFDTLTGHERKAIKEWERGDILTSLDLNRGKLS